MAAIKRVEEHLISIIHQTVEKKSPEWSAQQEREKRPLSPNTLEGSDKQDKLLCIMETISTDADGRQHA